MAISHIDITAFRNISKAVLKPHLELNLIIGNNGSGKTSLLEAVYVLGRGRSFRASANKKLIQQAEKEFILHCKTSDIPSSNIGIRVGTAGLSAKANHQIIKRSSDLATLLPLLFISPDADKLLQISPKLRRRFLDWGLFHVEHNYLELWKRYNRTLIQRNSLLKSSMTDISVWDNELINYGNKINEFRTDYVSKLNDLFLALNEKLLPEHRLRLVYKKGWPKDLDLHTAITTNLEADKKMGFTHRGPHRCDLQVLFSDSNTLAEPLLSGGQLKLVAICLILAQAILVTKNAAQKGILLVDDIAAELDSNKRKLLIEIMLGMDMQIFITSTDVDLIDLPEEQSRQVFHVEHGCITATDVSS